VSIFNRKVSPHNPKAAEARNRGSGEIGAGSMSLKAGTGKPPAILQKRNYVTCRATHVVLSPSVVFTRYEDSQGEKISGMMGEF